MSFRKTPKMDILWAVSLFLVLFKPGHAQQAKVMTDMVTQVNGVRLTNNEFMIGSGITITCSLNNLGGQANLPTDPPFDTTYNAVPSITLLRKQHSDGAQHEELARYLQFSQTRANKVESVKQSGWTYTFGDVPNLNVRDATGSAETMSLTLTIAQTQCNDQADYVCRLSYVDTNNIAQDADFHQNITAKAQTDETVNLRSVPDNNPPDYFIGENITFDCTFNGPTGMTLQWHKYSCPQNVIPSSYTVTTEGSVNNGPDPADSCQQKTYRLNLVLTVDEQVCGIRCVAGLDNRNINRAILGNDILAEANKTITPTPTDPGASSAGLGSSGDDTGMIVGIVVGLLALIVIVLLVTYFFWYRPRRQQDGEKGDTYKGAENGEPTDLHAPPPVFYNTKKPSKSGADDGSVASEDSPDDSHGEDAHDGGRRRSRRKSSEDEDDRRNNRGYRRQPSRDSNDEQPPRRDYRNDDPPRRASESSRRRSNRDYDDANPYASTDIASEDDRSEDQKPAYKPRAKRRSRRSEDESEEKPLHYAQLDLPKKQEGREGRQTGREGRVKGRGERGSRGDRADPVEYASIRV